MSVLHFVELFELLFKLLRECIPELGEGSRCRGVPRWPAHTQVVHEEFESAHLVVIVRVRREVQLAERLAEHFPVTPWICFVLLRASLGPRASPMLTEDIHIKEGTKN